MEALVFATQILNVVPSLLAAGLKVEDLVVHANTALQAAQSNGTGKVSAEDWEASNKMLADLRIQLHS